MTSATACSTMNCTDASLAAVEADLLAVPWFEGESAATVPTLDDASGSELGRAIASKEFAAHPHDLFFTPVRAGSGWHVRRLALVGAGPRSGYSADLLRKLAATLGLAARQRRTARVAFALREEAVPNDVAGLAQAASEGLTLSEFDAGRFKTVDPPPGPLPSWTIVVAAPGGGAHARDAVARGRVLGECSNLARELSNQPGNELTPVEFSRRCEQILGGTGVSVEVLDDQRIASLGMGLLLGVARGSSEPPRLMVFRHQPAGAPRVPILGLVGKGITFDTGGISIKPADGMERMKDDMSGGAAVACAMRAIGLLGAPISVVGVVPATENMPGGRAIKPGDVLRSASGKTVEVINTDAEGRLVLGDALWYAQQLGATHLVDVATLTGACVVALGKSTSGLFGAPDEWVEQIRAVANRAGDHAWPLPLVDEYRDQLKSEIADIANTGGRPAGSITAALFLKEFTGALPWAHLDIAGTAWVEEAKPYLPKGPTGVAVRTLAELAFTRASSWPAVAKAKGAAKGA